MNWTSEKPQASGTWLWRATGSNAVTALVFIHQRPTKDLPGGPLKGMVLHGAKFYDECLLTAWVGEWFGPIPF